MQAAIRLPSDSIHRWFDRTLIALPPHAESLATPLSDDLVFNWCAHTVEHAPGDRIENYGWDLRRRCGDERGRELFLPLVEEWGDVETFDATWASFDRPESDDDRLIVNELACLHSRRGGSLDELILPEDGDALRDELSALADRFDDRHLEATKAAGEDIKHDKGFMGRDFRERIDALEALKLARDMKNGTVPMPSNVVQFPPSAATASADPLPDLIQSSGAFVEGFVPPEYVLDRVLQRRFCYSFTAQTGVGKTAVAMLMSAHVATGRPLGSLDVAKGSVLYFAGENPTDVQMRWLGLCQELKLDPGTTDVHFVAGALPLSQVAERITAEVVRNGLTLALVVVDTAAAYNEGDDENSNTQAGVHARRLRSLTTLPGGPCVVILCHPTKRAGDDDLIPRGGGAFLAEVDGNIALQKRESLIVASAQGKFRGADFSPLSFELKAITHPVLKDSRGRDIWTVVASPLSDAGKQQIEAAARRHEDGLLRAIEKHPGASLRDLATALRWLDKGGKPVAERVRRATDVLAREKLIVKHRGAWQLTPKGQKELNDLDRAAPSENYPLTPVTPLVTPIRPLPPLPPRS